jgi:hypothetical protein
MAKKKATKKMNKTAKKKRIRRSPDQIIADLQSEITRLREKQKAKELKNSPSLRSSLAALKAIDKALDVAAEEGDSTMRHTLADCRRILAAQLEKAGFTLPKANLPKGRRPKELSEQD